MLSKLIFKRALEAVAHIADHTPPWDGILNTARDLIGADSGTLIMMDGQGGLLGLNQVGLDKEAITAYAEHYHKLDLLAEAASKVSPGIWLDSNELFPASSLRRTEFYTDYQRKHGHEQSLALVLEQNPLRRTGLSFQRSTVLEGAKSKLLDGDVAIYIQSLQAALARRNASMASQLKTVEDTFTALGEASCLVAPSGVVLRYSPLAGQLLDHPRGLCIRQGHMWHPAQPVRALLSKRLIDTINTGIPSRVTVALARGETLRLDITVAGPQFRMSDEPLNFIRLRRLSAMAELDVLELVAIFGITMAEAKVLAGLASGLTPAEFAMQHGVSESTVRKQVASLKTKMNCSRAVELVKLALLSQR
ncbi:LuxR C-terminal-related transcriptional regulator [Cupriavidus necator]|uniref:helix-turn-helix transcriptional regulator n=1 Tax=Cupriavidus necator TaxID=106590 RepID=UPI0039C17FA8